jgi:hypothetical protein
MRPAPLIAAAFLAALTASPAAARPDEPAITVLRVPDSGIQPQALAAPDGTLHLLYFKGDARAGDLFYITRAGGAAAFSQPIRVNSQPGSAIAIGNDRGGQLALGRAGRIHVAWNGSGTATSKAPKNPAMPPDSPYSGTPMLYARLTESRDAFEPQRNLITASTALDGGGSVAADSSGNVYVVWHALPLPGPGQSIASGESARRVFVTRSTDDGATFAPEIPASPDGLGACGCCGLKALAAPDGSLNILFRAATRSINRDATFLRSTDHAASFTAARLDPWELNSCPMSTAAIVASHDSLFLGWETRADVLFARRAPDGTLSRPASAPGSGGNRKYPALAVNSRGQILLAWTEGMSWDHSGSLHWQLFSPDFRPLPTAAPPGDPVPAWSLVAVTANPDGSFTVIY